MRKQAFERDLASNAPCWICGKPIDYTADPRTDQWAWQPDHVLSVKDHPEYALELGNLRPSHAWCNNHRGQEAKARRRKDESLGEPSEDWGL